MAPHPGRVATTLTSSESGDLETALPGWLGEGSPLGIETVIRKLWHLLSNGGDTAAVEASRIFERNGFPSLRHKNCLSFYESVDLAQADLDSSVGLGFLEKFGSLEEVQAKFDEDVRVTRIACLVKVKANKIDKGSPDRGHASFWCQPRGNVLSYLGLQTLRLEQSISWKLGRGTGLSHGAWLTSLRGMEKASNLQQLTSQTLFSLCRCWSVNGSMLSSKASTTGTFSEAWRSGSPQVHSCGASWRRHRASMSLCHKTRPTQSSRSSRSSRLRLGCTRSKRLCPWLGSWVGCQALYHVSDHLCRTCEEQFMPLRMARQPENMGPRHSSSSDGWNTQRIGSGKRQPVQDAVCPCGQGRDTAVVHRGRCF